MKSTHREHMYPIVLVFSVLVVVIFVLQVFAINIHPVSENGTQFVVGNTIFITATDLKFKSITIAPSYIVFNTTRFDVFSFIPVKISLLYLHPSIPHARSGEKIVEFSAKANLGLILVTLSGFPKNASFSVNSEIDFFLYRFKTDPEHLAFLSIVKGSQRFSIIKL